MRSYWVKYIDRDGETARRLIVAPSAKEARRIAVEEGCEDIEGVRRAHFLRRLFLRLLFLAALVAAVVAAIRWA